MEQGTDEWLAERAGKITASMIGNVLMAPTTAGYQNYMAQLICERLTGEPVETFKSAAMEYGTEHEDQARAFYEMETGNDVQQVGFVAHATLEGCGASPDGMIGELGLVEIKVPQPTKHIKNLMGGTIDKAYRLQMQWQMTCTGREWCDFVSFNPTFPPHLQIHIQRVDRDAEVTEELTEAATKFLAAMNDKMRALEARAA